MPIMPGQARTMSIETLVNRLVSLCESKGQSKRIDINSDINVLKAEIIRRDKSNTEKTTQLTLPSNNTGPATRHIGSSLLEEGFLEEGL